MAVWGSNLLLNLWGLVIWQHGITVWLSTNIKQTIKRSLLLWKDNFLSARKGHSYTVTETFIWSLVHSHSEHIFTSMTLSFFFCRKAMASLNKPDQTGPYCTPILCVLRVTRTEIKSYYSNEPCDMHKKTWSKIIYIKNWSFLNFKYLFLHWISISPAPPSLVNRASCSCPEWSAAGGGTLSSAQPFLLFGLMECQEWPWTCHWRGMTHFGAGICWQQNSGLLISSPGSRQGCALVGTVFYVSFWSMVFPASPFHSWDATQQSAACTFTHHLGWGLQTTRSSRGPQLHLAVRFKVGLVYLQEWQWK